MHIVQYDLYRATGKTDLVNMIKLFLRDKAFRRIVYYRYYFHKGFIGRLARICNHISGKGMSLEIQPYAKIGKGVLFIHPHSITINSCAVIGDNCTILKGATIGNSKTGKVGAPVIGNNVYIGLNSSVVGGIIIGNDVMIAPNTFVNFDVPDGALVLGSPGVIHEKKEASRAYIVNDLRNL